MLFSTKTCSMIPLYDWNKFVICQKQSKETLMKVSSDSRAEQIKNAFRNAPSTL